MAIDRQNYDHRKSNSNQSGQNPSSAVTALSLAKEGFEKSSKEFKDSVKTFGTYISRLEKSMKEATDDQKQSETKEKSDREKQLDKLSGISDKHLSKAQVIGSTLINTFSTVAGFAIKQFTDASNRIIQSYNQNLEAITVRQQWTNQQYTQELRKATDWIRNEGLVQQFSQIDWTNSLSEALSTGLRDQMAEQVAERNLIARKLLPQLQLNSRTYTRANKLLGESLNQNVVAIGKYTEKIYGAEGLEEGQINNFMETLLNEVMYAGTQQGLSKDQVGTQVGNMLGSYQQYANQYGSQYSESMLGALKGYLEGDVSNVGALTAASQAGIQYGDAGTITASNVDKFMKYYTEFVASQSGNGPGVMGNVVSIGPSSYDYMAVANAKYYGKSYQDFMSMGVNAQSEYRSQENALKQGQYQTAQGRLDKVMENATADISSTIAQYVPENALSSISTIVSKWFKAWVTIMSTKTVTDAASNIAGGLLGKGGGTILPSGSLKALPGTLKAGITNLGYNAGYGSGTAFGAGMNIIAGTAIGASEAAYGGYLTYDAIKNRESRTTAGWTGQATTGALGATAGAAGGIMAAAGVSGPAAPIVLAAGAIALFASSVIKANTAINGLHDELEKSQTSFNDMILASDEYNETQKKNITSAYKELRDELEKEFQKDKESYRKDTTEDMIKSLYGDEMGFGSIERSSYEGSQAYDQLMNMAAGIQDAEKQEKFIKAVDSAFKSHGGLSKTELRALMGRRTVGANLRAFFSKDIDLQGSWFNTVSDIDTYKSVTGSTNGNLYGYDELEKQAIQRGTQQSSNAVGSDFITGTKRALLHKGEAVLTSRTASKLRKLASGSAGLSGFIDSLWNLSTTASAVPEETKISFDPVVDAINKQTEELKNSLVQIISIIDPTNSNIPKAKHDKDLVGYRGAGG